MFQYYYMIAIKVARQGSDPESGLDFNWPD